MMFLPPDTATCLPCGLWSTTALALSSHSLSLAVSWLGGCSLSMYSEAAVVDFVVVVVDVELPRLHLALLSLLTSVWRWEEERSGSLEVSFTLGRLMEGWNMTTFCSFPYPEDFTGLPSLLRIFSRGARALPRFMRLTLCLPISFPFQFRSEMLVMKRLY